MTIRNIILTIVLSVSLAASAVPARRDTRVVTQPDGTTLTVSQIGDEYLHYLITGDGNIITRGANGYYRYGNVDAQGCVTPTNIIASNITPANAGTNIADIDLRALHRERLDKRMAKIPTKTTIAPQTAPSTQSADNPYAGLGRMSTTFPTTGDIRGLVILVQYADVPFTLDDPYDYFNDMLNGENFTQYGGTGSAAAYFRKSSNGAFRPTFDVFGPVTLPKNRAYYGGNDTNGNDLAPEYMLIDAVNILRETTDFSKYDMDNDGYVDYAYIFYAGQGEASYGSEDTVWPHAWYLSSAGKTLSAGGKYFNRYACSDEWQISKPEGLGTFVHEFSHVMGLPDLYDVSYGSAAQLTPSSYDVLDYGPYNNDGRTPPIYSAYERNAMGWITPMITGDVNTIALAPLEDSNQCILLPTASDTEFFLLENRQNHGWDTYIPGHGMLVWHIDYTRSFFTSNRVNTLTYHQCVDIIEAGGKASAKDLNTLASYPFPGTANVTSLTPETSPSLTTWCDDKPLDIDITDIAEDIDGTILFNVGGGLDPLATPILTDNPEADATHFTASWQPVPGATDYTLQAMYVIEGTPESQTADMGSDTKAVTLPDGWTASTTDTYTLASNCGAAIPSLKFNVNGDWIQTRDFVGEITSVSFWLRGVASIGSTLSILVKDNDGWSPFEVIKVENKSAVYTFDTPMGVHAIKFIYNRNKGNIALDDITIATDTRERVLDGYDFISTGGATSMRIDALPGITHYRYRVRALDGMRRSPISDFVDVKIPDGVSNITIDSDDTTPTYYDIHGRQVDADNLTPGIYIRRAGVNVSKIIIR